MRIHLAICCLLLPGALAAREGAPWSIPDMEKFLSTARIASSAPAEKGLNHTRKMILTDGRRTHAAHFATLDVYMPLFKGKDGSEEQDFKDSWKFNVAAWRLARLMRLTNMTPACVARVIEGQRGSLCWWVDNVLMDEKERLARNISPPDVDVWNSQMETIRVFDQLIYNMDRSQENLLITKDWNAWMIDHSRAFRKWRQLRNAAAITGSNPAIIERLQALRRSDVVRELSPYLTSAEIEGLMARRDLIVDRLRARSRMVTRRTTVAR